MIDGERAGDPRVMDQFVKLDYHDVLSPPGVRYRDALHEGKLLGQRCPKCGLVYVPPRGYCPIDTVVLGEEHDLELADRGVITNYTIVTPVQYHGQKETEPFVRVSVLLDEPGGSLNLQDVVDVANEDVHAGMRVEAVWVPEADRQTGSLDNRAWGSTAGCIRGWRPTGEPDMAPDEYKETPVS